MQDPPIAGVPVTIRAETSVPKIDGDVPQLESVGNAPAIGNVDVWIWPPTYNAADAVFVAITVNVLLITVCSFRRIPCVFESENEATVCPVFSIDTPLVE